MSTTKRGPGAPLGNQNARTHGYFSNKLTLEQVNYLSSADVSGLDREITILRLKINSILANDPGNVPVLVKAMSSLSKLVKAKQRLDPNSLQDLSEALQKASRDFLPLIKNYRLSH